MAWYRTGSVSIAKGATSVTGVGTRWASNARVGDAFRGPDGEWYEIVNIADETTLGILPAYQGATASNSAVYTIAPMQGYVKESADRLRQITNGIEDVSANVEKAAASASAAKISETNAASSATKAASSATAAGTSATNAKTSETNAKTSETNAKASETAANTSKNAAATSATNASGSASDASSSASAAAGSASAAATSNTNAGNSATASKNSATAAATSATNAKTSETNAKTSETNASSSASAAKTSETNAKTSETNSASSASAANTSKNAAATSATNASASETKAKAWAINPENTAVESGSYSALHWAAKAKASADKAESVNGPRLTSIAAAVLSVNDMLIADTTTTMAKIATGAMGRAVLAANNNQQARTALGLGPSANYDVISSIYDQPVGSGLGNLVLRQGAFGLGSTDLADMASGTDLNTINATGFYQVNGGANTNSPLNGLAGQMMVMTNATNHITQIFSPQDKTSRLFTRSSVKTSNTDAAPDFGPWSQIVMAGDFGLGSTGYLNYMTGSVDDFTRANGTYSVSSSNAGTKPSGQNFGILEVLGRNNIEGSGSRIVQIWHVTDGNQPSQMWIRHVSTSTPFAWTDWREMAGVDSITSGLAAVGLGLTNAANAIPANADLNTYQTTGMYGQSQNAQASNGTNYPVAKAGSLLVQNGGTAITTQQYTEYDSGRIWSRSRYNSSWTVWKALWNSGDFEKTANALDSTSGKILQVGDFGLGLNGNAIAPQLTNLDATDMATGFYTVRGSSVTTGTYPGGSSTYGTMIVQRYNQDGFQQIYIPLGSKTGTGANDPASSPRMYMRVYNSPQGGFSAWERVATSSVTSAWGLNTNFDSSSQSGFCSNVDDFDIPNGLYVADSGTTGTKPSGQTWGTVIVTGRNFTAGRVSQTWTNTENYAGRTVVKTWKRLNYGRSWGAWIQDVSYDDLSTGLLGEVTIKSTNLMRFKNEGSTTAPALIQRIDAANYYMLLTNENAQDGSYNNLRPFSIGLTSGLVSMPNGATTSAPSNGDATTRIVNSSWVNSEFVNRGFGASNVTPAANDANASRLSGFYATNGGGGAITNYPVAANGMVGQYGWNGAGAGAQTFITTSDGAGRFFWRSMTGGNWQAWKESAPLENPFFYGDSTRFTGVNLTRYVFSGSTVTPAVINRIDKDSFYMLLTNENAQGGDFNSLRPFAIGLTSGMVTMNHGAYVGSPSADDVSTRAVNSSWVKSLFATKADVNAKEATISSGSTTQFWRGDKTWQDFGTMTRGQSLAGVNVALGGTIVSNDSILTGFGKTQSQLNAIVGDNQNITSLRATKYIDKIFVGNASGAPYNCNIANQTVFELTLTGNTTLAITGVPTLNTNELLTVVITVKQGSTARALTLPSGTRIIAPGGTIAAPAANKQQDYIFTLKSGESTWEVRAGAFT